MKRIRRLITMAGLVLLGAALYEQLQKPPAQRTWHGKLWDVVPYDFRPPTLQRIRESFWNPENPSILTDRVLGVGWGINFYRVFQMARQLAGR